MVGGVFPPALKLTVLTRRWSEEQGSKGCFAECQKLEKMDLLSLPVVEDALLSFVAASSFACALVEVGGSLAWRRRSLGC